MRTFWSSDQNQHCWQGHSQMHLAISEEQPHWMQRALAGSAALSSRKMNASQSPCPFSAYQQQFNKAACSDNTTAYMLWSQTSNRYFHLYLNLWVQTSMAQNEWILKIRIKSFLLALRTCWGLQFLPLLGYAYLIFFKVKKMEIKRKATSMVSCDMKESTLSY